MLLYIKNITKRKKITKYRIYMHLIRYFGRIDFEN